MQKPIAYKIHTADALVMQIERLTKQGKHPFSMAVLNGDARDFHGDPTYLLDAPVGFSTRPANAVEPIIDQYQVTEIK